MWAEYLETEFLPDILHIYGFSAVVRFPRRGKHIPVVLGTSTGSYSDLRDYLGWPQVRIRNARRIKRQYLRLIDAHDTSLRPEKAARVHVWSRYSRRLHLDEGYVQPNRIDVIYPGLPKRHAAENGDSNINGTTFLFVGRDFERKNGQLLLRAFREVRASYASARLILVGSPLGGQKIDDAGVTHYGFLPRNQLIERIYPQADVLVLPSKAEGFGMVALEAMSFGMPVIGVNDWAMPELIEPGDSGYLIPGGSKSALVEAMSSCASRPGHLHSMKEHVSENFRQRFSIERHNRQLKQIYDRVLLG